jgi:hypothetical protein
MISTSLTALSLLYNDAVGGKLSSVYFIANDFAIQYAYRLCDVIYPFPAQPKTQQVQKMPVLPQEAKWADVAQAFAMIQAGFQILISRCCC